MNDNTRAIAVAALEYYRREANYQRYLASRGFEMPPNVDLIAEIDAALLDFAAPDAPAVAQGWQPLPDGEVAWGNLVVMNNGGTLDFGGGYDEATDAYLWHEQYDMPPNERLCKRADAPAPQAAPKEMDDES